MDKPDEKTLAALNIRIAELVGDKPVLEEWWAYKETADGVGSICFSAETKRHVEEWIAKLSADSWAKEYKPKAFYRYKDYTGSLDAIHGAEKWRTFTRAAAGRTRGGAVRRLSSA